MGRLQVRLKIGNRSAGANGRNGRRRLQRRWRDHLRSRDNDPQQRPVHARKLHPGVQRAEPGLLQRQHQLHPKQPDQSRSRQLFLSIIPTGSATTVNGQNLFYPQNTDFTQDSGTTPSRPELRQQQPGLFPLQPVRSVQDIAVGYNWQRLRACSRPQLHRALDARI